MKVDQLIYFQAVARCHSFSEAAEDCYISQSSLSKQILALENELGVKLFLRAPGNVVLTEEGKAILGYTNAIVREYNAILELARKRPHAEGTGLFLDYQSYTNSYRITPMLNEFRKSYPGEIHTSERIIAHILDRLRNGKIDAAVLFSDMLDQKDYQITPLLQDELILLGNKKPDGCQDDEPVDLAALPPKSFLALGLDPAMHEYVLRQNAKIGLSRTINFEVSIPTLKQYRSPTFYVLVPRQVARHNFDNNWISMELQEPIRVTLSFVTRKKPPAKAGLPELQKYAAEHFRDDRR